MAKMAWAFSARIIALRTSDAAGILVGCGRCGSVVLVAGRVVAVVVGTALALRFIG